MDPNSQKNKAQEIINEAIASPESIHAPEPETVAKPVAAEPTKEHMPQPPIAQPLASAKATPPHPFEKAKTPNSSAKFSNLGPQTNTSNPLPKDVHKKTNIFYVLFWMLLFIIIFVAVPLTVLNYFGIVDLGKLSPVFSQLPKKDIPDTIDVRSNPAPYYFADTDNYQADGSTLIGYDNDIINVKYANQVISLKFGSESKIYISKVSYENLGSSDSSDAGPEIGFLSDLEQNKNIGKRIDVQYKKNNKEYIIEKITLYP